MPRVRRSGLALGASALLAFVAFPALSSAARAAVPASGTLMQSPQGFVGCVDPGAPASPATYYCSVAEMLPSGSNAGSLSVNAWTYKRTLPGTVVTDEQVVAPASGLQVSPDGSFTFGVQLPQMGTVSIVGVSGGVRLPADWYDGPPLQWQLASQSGVLPYFSGSGNYMV